MAQSLRDYNYSDNELKTVIPERNETYTVTLHSKDISNFIDGIYNVSLENLLPLNKTKTYKVKPILHLISDFDGAYESVFLSVKFGSKNSISSSKDIIGAVTYGTNHVYNNIATFTVKNPTNQIAVTLYDEHYTQTFADVTAYILILEMTPIF